MSGLRAEEFAHLPEMGVHKTTFRRIFSALLNFGVEVSPRNQLVKEIENFSYTLPPYVRFANFSGRKLNLQYIKAEFLWYLRGNKFDTSITDHAAMWKGLINIDGSINSNYGQYIFGEEDQFSQVISILRADRDSRRASIVILNSGHLASDTRDVPCTYSINFRIRANRLNMTVRMRSQDAIFGMGNDAPIFSLLHEMVLSALQEFYPGLQYGEYYHSADSFHIYQRHFKMLDDILEDGEAEGGRYTVIMCPKINGPDEVRFLRAGDFSDAPGQFQFTKWLLKQEKNVESP